MPYLGNGLSKFTTADDLTVSGDADIDGTTNLDVVDIDGAVDMASTLTVTGNVLVGTTTEGISDYGDTLTIADTDHAGMTIRSGTSSEGNVYFSDGTSGDAEYKGIVKYDHSSNAMSFWSNSLRRATIDSNGNLGLGTDAPGSKFEIYGEWSSNHGQLTINNTGANQYGGHVMQYQGTAKGYLYHENNNNLVSLVGATSQGLSFHTNSNGTNNERMRLTSAGLLGLGVTAPDGKLNVVSTAHNNGSIFDSTGTTQLWLRDTDAASNQKNWGFQVSGGDLNIVRANDDRASGFVTPIYIQQAPANSLVIDTNGNLLVGKAAEGVGSVGFQARSDGFFAGTRDGGTVSYLNRLSSNGEILRFQKDSSTTTSIGSVLVNTTLNGFIVLEPGSGGAGIAGYGGSSNGALVPCNESGAIADNAKDWGASSARWDDIFASNGTIQTSDENEKQNIASLTSAEITAAKAISKLFKTFKWKDKVTAKGDAARTHTGVIAQEVQAAMSAAGLDATKYAFWCSDTWTNDDGSEQTRMGVRYPELMSFVLSSIEDRITALENAQ